MSAGSVIASLQPARQVRCRAGHRRHPVGPTSAQEPMRPWQPHTYRGVQPHRGGRQGRRRVRRPGHHPGPAAHAHPGPWDGFTD